MDIQDIKRELAKPALTFEGSGCRGRSVTCAHENVSVASHFRQSFRFHLYDISEKIPAACVSSFRALGCVRR